MIYPCVGRTASMKKYIKTWQMQPLSIATIASLIPDDVERQFYDDRLEAIAYDEPTDLVFLSVETYTAKRCYQIASEYRKRGIPVVMGGFHATLCTDEVLEYAESVVVGEAEPVIQNLIDDYRHGTPQRIYKAQSRPELTQTMPDRNMFKGKNYINFGLIEFARGCKFKCDFCAIQSYYEGTVNHRPIQAVVEEIKRMRKRGQLIFFVDDNICSDLNVAKELMHALIPLKISWVSQGSINIAYDEEALVLLRRSGCKGLLVGLESLNPAGLKTMNKGFNLMQGGPEEALANFRKHHLCVYGTFVFGYDNDTYQTFDATLEFARKNGLFIAGLNHLRPFPGTPLYDRIKNERRLLYEKWWMDEDYRYDMLPFKPANMSAAELEQMCVDARRKFYSWPSILQRAKCAANRSNLYMFANYLIINAMHRRDVVGRGQMPLGDQMHQVQLLKVS
ncbi:B12-binding domain-containing radical SAM protein [Planctomycetota bacterium]|nr:B12-binding domain-containing radical SAM protein [Planctomycetota bacterium]